MGRISWLSCNIPGLLWWWDSGGEAPPAARGPPHGHTHTPGLSPASTPSPLRWAGPTSRQRTAHKLCVCGWQWHISGACPFYQEKEGGKVTAAEDVENRTRTRLCFALIKLGGNWKKWDQIKY